MSSAAAGPTNGPVDPAATSPIPPQSVAATPPEGHKEEGLDTPEKSRSIGLVGGRDAVVLNNGVAEKSLCDIPHGQKTIQDGNDSSAIDTTSVELDDFGLPIRTKSRNQTPAREVSIPGDINAAKDEKISPHDSENVEGQEPSSSITSASGENQTDGHPQQPKADPISKAHSEAIPPSSAEKVGSESTSGQGDAELSKSSDEASTQPPAVQVSEWSHQRLTTKDETNDADADDDGGWQAMPALGILDHYDDHGRLVARAGGDEDDSEVYRGLGGAGKGYTRVQIDDDTQSVTSLDDDTKYLFKEPENNALGIEDEDLRDPLSQLQATKDLLTEGQRIAYVGVTRLTIFQMVKDLEAVTPTRSTKKYFAASIDSMTKWGQQMMIRLYAHMDINTDEQVMIEQLAEHGVQPADLVRPLMQNARVKNPLVSDETSSRKTTSTLATPNLNDADGCASVSEASEYSTCSSSPPPYEETCTSELPEAQTVSQLPTSDKLDIDLRWTVLCDIFLVLIADSNYDSRSRRLLERVAEAMEVTWLQICRFEKRVIDALEMQEEADKETWDEAEHMETRRKKALNKKYMYMGLATVGGGLVIGLSAGLLAPVIGLGLAAGLSTIGISGTGAFLGGVGGTALIASGATLTGSTIAVRASHRRTGAVQTFEYRPLHNNKRVNLIVTVAGWMNGKVDDVRLPYSTVDPVMGDIYSVLWEPEMLQSMGATINILATEALTQGLQQVLGSTILTALMASLQLPIVLTKLSYLIDNPWNVSLVRANAAGLIMADSIMARNLGKRPITLLGFSLGSRVIFSCLKELAKHGAHGLIQNVYLFGSPIVANRDEYLKASSVVSGRFVNGYASNDWILGYLFRATSGGIMRIAGIAPVENVPGVENINVTEFVNGHMAYRTAMPRLLREVGWEVESDEFTEIEDPDPENHQQRQRELIREIEDARKEAEEKPDKKRFGFFKRGKLAEKKGWETYDVDQHSSDPSQHSNHSTTSPGTVLFDVDAIRAELAGEQIEVRQLESTLPPMKLNLNSPPTPSSSAASSIPPSSAKQQSEISVKSEFGTSSSGPNHSSTDKPEKSAAASPYQWPDEPAHRYSDHLPRYEDHELDMTFDTAYHTPPQRSVSAPFPNIMDSAMPPASSRLELLSSTTMPTPTPTPVQGGGNPPPPLPRFGSTLSLSHNAWADDDDHNNGKEKEIQMTFE
ncbi:hypothetical protein AJ80_07555 [Polytolypa hystricis UAMH7299]|uniref:DUF726 domain-containing protein n=1 Tax=Polytolypa hystricis (strain UAMH7299) TaxID=1447883 RepID=A0A2B7XM22_POLH7|nr:hypothetical protein AJ80_07555 [Polytolypa hystricis UAMH7299]